MTITTELQTNDPALREAMYRAHKGRCFYTGQPVDFEHMVIDHIVPRLKGGHDCIENYVPTFNYVNLLKGDRGNLETERMVFINRLIFAPRVVLLYGKRKSKASHVNGLCT